MDFLDDTDRPEEAPTPPPSAARRKRRRRSRGFPPEFWDTLSVLLLVGTLLLLILAFIIFQNPYTPINPYPPSTPVAVLVLPTRTPTPSETISLPHTWTPTASATPSVTPTPPQPTQTKTPAPSQTGSPQPATATVPVSAYKYLPRGEPNYLSGTIIHPDEGCKIWVAGQAFDMKASPVIGITVEMGGELDGKNVYLLSLTGTQLQYGPGGYEFVLAEKAIKSKGSVWVQLLDQELNPLSARVIINTFDTCDKNLVLVNFKQVK